MVESKASKNVLRLFYLLGKMLKLHAIEFIDDNVPVKPGIQMVEVTTPTSTHQLKIGKYCIEQMKKYKPLEDGNALVYPFVVVMNMEFDNYVRLYSKGVTENDEKWMVVRNRT